MHMFTAITYQMQKWLKGTYTILKLATKRDIILNPNYKLLKD